MLRPLLVVCWVVILTGCGSLSGGSHTGSSQTSSPPRQPVSWWIGDSYTADHVAKFTSAVLGWVGYVEAEGGTGYVANGHIANPAYKPLPKRLTTDVERVPAPDVVVIDAGRNDWQAPAAEFRRVVTSYFRALAKAYPSAAIVVIAPYEMTKRLGNFVAMRRILGRQARLHHWAFVDPIADGWINATSAKLVISDGIHPSVEGAQYIAEHLAPAIEKALAAAHESVP